MKVAYSCYLLLTLVSFSGCVQKQKVTQEQVMQEIKELQKQKASKVLVTITYANGKKLSVELDPAVFVECLMEAGSFDEEVFD